MPSPHHAVPLLVRSATIALRTPSLWLPALVLLAPTLLVQLLAPGYLRTRLAPSLWTVVVGSLCLTWLGQVAWPVVSACVHARLAGRPARVTRNVLAVALSMGTRTTLGLAAGILPGLWLQARYAFAPLIAAGGTPSASHVLRASARESSPAIRVLLSLSAAAFVATLGGQSVAAVVAEALGTIRPVGVVEGRVVFELAYAPHAVTSLVAYLISSGVMTAQAVGVSLAYGGAYDPPYRMLVDDTPGSFSPATRATAMLVAAAGLAAVAYKLHQHVF